MHLRVVGGGGFLVFDTSGVERMRVSTAGNVGIGTASPTYPLHVQSPGPAARLETSGSAGPYLAFAVSGVEKGYLGADGGALISGASQNDITLRSGAQLRFATGGPNQRMVIDAAGNVGIGTASPSCALDVSGFARLHNGATDGPRLIWSGGSGGTQEYRARVDPNGTLSFFPAENGPAGSRLRKPATSASARSRRATRWTWPAQRASSGCSRAISCSA
jgi:hypothetical protein